MSKKTEKLRLIFSILLTILFLSTSVFSVLAKPDTAKTPVEDFQISDEEEEEDEEEERELTPEEIAAKEAAEKAAQEALEKKRSELEKKVTDLGKDYSAIKSLLTDKSNAEAVSGSKLLLEKILEALLADKKPNYESIRSYGDKLSKMDKGSSLAFYAQGLGQMYAKKPNLAKAMDFFGKAKSAKNPYKDAASAYTTCLLKRFGLFIALVPIIIIALTVVVIIKKKKAKKAALENAEGLGTEDNNTDVDLQKLLEDPLDNAASNETKATDNNVAESNSANGSETNKDNNVTPVATPASATVQANQPAPKSLPEPASNNVTNNVATTQKLAENASNKVEPAKTGNAQEQTTDNAAGVNETANVSAAPAKKVVRVVKKVRVRKDANGNSYVVSEDTAQQTDSSQSKNNNIGQSFEELETIRGISRPDSKPLPPVDTQLDILWGNLSRKAMQGHIGLMARKSDSLSSALTPTSVSGATSYPAYNNNENRINDIRFGDVSIDLSEEALKDDLVGKLKMLAITDSELRELFALRNPSHIPHLIEYIMTKPEPARLAFVAKELGNYPDPAVVDALSSLLYHEDERVVLAAIQGLEATKLPAAIIPLCPFLRADIPLYAQAARTALSKFGAVKIMQALKDLPSFTDIKLKEAGIFVLSRMKGEPVEKILKTLLNDESSSVRIQTILAMSYQKNPVYIDALREFYRIANETEKSMTRKAIVYLNGFNK